MKQLGLYLRTLAHLRPSQVAYFLRRRILHQSGSVVQTSAAKIRFGISMQSEVCVSSSTGDDRSFCFLRQSKPYRLGHVDWVSKDMPKLWRYNLHYFDYLHDPHRSYDSRSRLITDWIQHNPEGTEDAWEPYTASLRIVNWIKFFLAMGHSSVKERTDELLMDEWVESLYQQALWLEQNIEYHFLANHYLKNGVALFFAGVYFEGSDADRWLQKGLKILREELDEQFLADGGHFERSPMYHSICLVDYLDVLNLAQGSSAVIPCDIVNEFARQVTKAVDFLNGICLPDGTIPLFNDSALGIAPTPYQISAYAGQVLGYKPPAQSTRVMVRTYPSSGYYVCRQHDDMIIVDCGPIGAEYNPAHAHCDTLSYELAIEGRPVVVDSGVYDYEPSEERAYARSTRAHNTVMIDGEEQSEIWGVFRVARRAEPLSAHMEQTAHNAIQFEGAHDGYVRLSGRPIHTRRISYRYEEASWVITDIVKGDGRHQMESLVHIHPDLTVAQLSPDSIRIDHEGNAVAIIEASNACQMTIERGCYFPEFGLSQKNLVLAFSCSGELPLQLSYRIHKTTDRYTKAIRHANSLPITLFPPGGERPRD